MNTLPGMVAAGMLCGAGAATAVYALTPRVPHLADALSRLSPRLLTAPGADANDHPVGAIERLGFRAQRRLVNLPGLRIPTVDLRLLDKSTGWFLGRKIAAAAFGLLLPPMFSTLGLLLGIPIPFVIPAVISLVLAAAMWFVPDLEVAGKAKEAREEYGRAVTAYIDLVALHSLGGLMPGQALEDAARIGTAPVFERLSQELTRASWERQPLWRALHTLSDELKVPELTDLADRIRDATEQGANVADQLRLRAHDLRAAQLAKEQARANAASERMSAPTAMLALVFGLLLVTPPLLKVIAGAG